MNFFFDFIFLGPELFLSLNFINIIFFFSVLKKTNCNTFSGLIYLIYLLCFCTIMILLTLFLSLNMWEVIQNNSIYLIFNTIKKSAINFIIQNIILICSILFLLYLKTYLTYTQLTDLTLEYIYIIILNIWGFMFLITTNDLLFLFFMFEFTSFGIYILINYNIVSNKAIESGIKYFIFGAIISSILLFAIFLIYICLGTTNFDDINLLLNFISIHDSNIWVFFISLSILLIFLAIAFKLGLFPFHFWPPMIYDGISYRSLLYIFSIPKISYVYLILNFYYNLFFEYLTYNSYILTLIAIFSIIIGSLSALAQTKLKKLLSFSGIVNFGYIILLITTTSGYDLIYIILSLGIYISNIYLLFFLILYISKYKLLNNLSLTYISELKTLKSKNFIFCIIFAQVILSLSGFPPFGGFFIKYLLLLNLLYTNSYFIFSLFLIINVISSFYYIRLIRLLFFNKIPSIGFYQYYGQHNNSNLQIKQNLMSTNTGLTLVYFVWFIFNIYICLNPDLIYFYLCYLLF